jgi:tRNA nucleotidyltransferase (CCA-adding enzyme)
MNIEEKIIERLIEKNFQVFISGGFVRDHLLGIDNEDIDIVTNAKPHEIISLFEKDFDVVHIGNNFPVVSVAGIEVATFRNESSFGTGTRDFNVTFADTVEEDVARRDLTINAMVMCPFVGDVIDFFGGLEDLKNKIIRFVGNPDERIKEDAVRIIRAARFAAKIGGKIEINSLRAMKKNKDLIDTVPSERIRTELLKVMKVDKPSLFFRTLNQVGVLKKILPSLARTVGHDGGIHHKEDIFTHNMMVGDAIGNRCQLLRLAAFLHDIGKPPAMVKNKKRGFANFSGHDKIGADIAKEDLLKLRFSTDEVNFITGLIKHHMGDLMDLQPKTARKLFVRLKNDSVNFFDLLRLRVADTKGNMRNLGKKMPVSELKRFFNTFETVHAAKEEAVFSLKDLKIDGNDIMNILKIKPSPLVGEILRELFNIVVEFPEINEPHILKALL